MSDFVMKPWTPVKVTEDGNNVGTHVWGRDYTSGSKSFLESVVSQGDELLAGPVRFVGTEEGTECVWDDWKNFLMADFDDVHANVSSTVKSEQFVINTSMKVEYDGCIDTSLIIMPRGQLLIEKQRGERNKQYGFKLERLWMEIPFKPECAKYFQQFSVESIHKPSFESAGLITEDIQLPFQEQVLISNDKTGFIIFFESQKNFEPFYNDKAFEIIKKDNEVVLRIRFFDEEPTYWRDCITASGRENLFPIMFRFGMMATPIKPIPKTVFKEKAVHIDCYKKILNDYEEFLSSPFEGTDEITFDRLERLGVNTLYLHEKWNDMQNSPVLTARTARRIRYIVKEAHDRGIKVVPYFGYEMSTLAPYYVEKYDTDSTKMTEANSSWHWYRVPEQKATQVCQKSDWSEFFTDHIEKLIDEYNFDGVYLDGTPFVRPCLNTAHGCGVVDPNGKLHVTYPVWGTRKTMKKLYEIIVEKRGGIINCHAGSTFNLAALAFCTSLWDGEAFQWELMEGKITTLPDDYFRGLYSGRNIGLPIYMLCYLRPPVWDFEMALSTSLPFGIIPKSNDAGEPLEKMSEIWKIYDAFDAENAEWVPYYSDVKPKIKCSDDRFVAGAYQYENKLLGIVASFSKEYEGEFEVECAFRNIKNARTGEILSTNGKATVTLNGISHLILEAWD